jgi:hypothetical protein
MAILTCPRCVLMKWMRWSARLLSVVGELAMIATIVGFAGCASPTGSAPRSNPAPFDAKAFGAKGDGQTVDTTAIQAAINSAAKAGGGVVLLSSGRFVSGTLILQSHVTLRIETGATLAGSTWFADYRDLSAVGRALPVSQYNQDEARFRGLLIALDQDDIAVTGGGTIDGRGAAVAASIHQMQVHHQLPGDPKYRPDEALRPCLINFVRCHDVRVADITLRDSACWVENYTACDGLIVDHVTVRSQAFWNNDGIDISGCQHVGMSHCDIDSADDGICLKSNSTACENVEIRDCRVRSWANAIKFGTVSFVGFRHISISNIQVWGCGHAGLSIESVDGAQIEDVKVSNLTMTNLRQAILVKLGSRHTPRGAVGSIKDLTLNDITAELSDGDPDAGQKFRAPVPSYKHNRFPCVVSGLPGHPIENLTLQRITYHTTGGGTAAIAEVPLEKLASIPEHAGYYPEYSMHGELPAYGWFIRHAAGLRLESAVIDCRRLDDRAAVVCDDVSHLDISGLRVSNPGEAGPVVALSNVHHAVVENGTAATAPGTPFVRLLDQCDGIKEIDNQTH